MRAARPSRRARLRALALPLLGLLTGCASRVPLSTTPGTPLPDLAGIHASLTRSCAGVTTLTAELALSGRSGGQRVRGRAVAGFALPDAMRLEGVAPFGAPVFLMVARGGTATLVLPREHAALTGVPPEDVLGALAGVALSPSDLLAMLTGCVEASPVALSGVLLDSRHARLVLAGGSVLQVTRAGAGWRLRAATRGGWDIVYLEWPGAFPSAVRLRRAGGAGREPVDLVLRPAQLETNTTLSPEVFLLAIPEASRRLTLDDLRDAAPLKGAP